MKQKNWIQIEQKIKTQLETELRSSRSRPIAAFDADGTLWNTDLGEAFFKYQINQHLLKNLPENPWDHYRKWKESGDPRPAYLWLAQINKGHKIAQVRQWAEEAVRTQSPLPIFEEQKSLIEFLQSKKVEIFIITASVSWAVEPGAQRLAIPIENVIGVHTKVKKNIITEEQDGLISYREGKLEALLQMTGGRKPFFACGNTMGDFALLDGAQLRLAVGAAQPGDELYTTEERLRQEATSRGWMTHQFL